MPQSSSARTNGKDSASNAANIENVRAVIEQGRCSLAEIKRRLATTSAAEIDESQLLQSLATLRELGFAYVTKQGDYDIL